MAVLNAYDMGDCVRLSCTFATCSSTAGDPTTVALTIRDPDGVETEYTYAAGKVARSTTGSYYKDVTLSTAGTYYYRLSTRTDRRAGMEGGVARLRARRRSGH